MSEQDYLELITFVESHENRDKTDKTEFSKQVAEDCKKRIENFKQNESKES